MFTQFILEFELLELKCPTKDLMKIEELHRLPESQRLEFKESFSKETVETVASFCNASGGIILIGVDKHGELQLSFETRNGVTRSGLISIAHPASVGSVYDTPQVTPQVTPQDNKGVSAIIKILLSSADREMSRSEIQKKLGLHDRFHFRETYLRPALDAQFIEMTIPDKPNSRYQKYRLTEKGKQMKL